MDDDFWFQERYDDLMCSDHEGEKHTPLNRYCWQCRLEVAPLVEALLEA